MTDRDLERRLAAIEARLPRGPMVSTTFGTTEIRPYQVGFPVELTSVFDTSTGYSWKRRVLDTTVPQVTDETFPQTGDMAFAIDNNEALTSGMIGWLEVDPGAGGYFFLPSPEAASATSVTAASIIFSGAHVYNSADISIASGGTPTLLTFDSEFYDTDSYHSTSSSTDRLTIPETGYYRVGAFIYFEEHATGARYLQLTVDVSGEAEVMGSSCGPSDTGPAGIGSHLNIYYENHFTAGTILRTRAYQSSGFSLNIKNDAVHKPRFWISRAGT